MDRAEFEDLVRTALESLPKRFQEKLENVIVVVEDWPRWEQLQKVNNLTGTTLFGLYEGVPKTHRMNYSLVQPDKITIFQKPIEFFRHTPEGIKEQVRKTVLHEIGHHFGLSESQLAKK